MSTRTSITQALHSAVDSYMVKKNFSMHHEVGIEKMGKLKIDVLAFNYKLHLIFFEVKSGHADFKSDKKFHKYLKYCHQFYWVITDTYWNSKACDELKAVCKEKGLGILVLNSSSGYLDCVKSASTLNEVLPKGFIKALITRLAWRAGVHRGNKRRLKVFVASGDSNNGK